MDLSQVTTRFAADMDIRRFTGVQKGLAGGLDLEISPDNGKNRLYPPPGPELIAFPSLLQHGNAHRTEDPPLG